MAGVSYRQELKESANALAGRARTAFGELLARPSWDWYVTLTFREEMKSPKLADRAFYGWFNAVRVGAKKSLELPSIYGPESPYYFRCTEKQERDVLHFHALVGGVGNIRRLQFKDLWELHGYARVVKYEPGRGANFYVGKYLNKNDGDIRFSHNLTPYLTSSR